MSYEPGAIEMSLAAAVGDEPALIAELREAFLQSVARGMAMLEAAQGEAAWRAAAWRLRGLAASFGAMALMALATEAAEAPAHDPALLRRLRQAVEQL